MKINPRTPEAMKLFMQGTMAFSRAELAGIRVDTEYIINQIEVLKQRMQALEDEFKETTFFKHWEHSTSKKININSKYQLSTFLYHVKKLEAPKLTDTGNGSTDEEALQQLNIPELNLLIKKSKIKKAVDVLQGFYDEQVDGFVHTSFNLNMVTTYRSCIAKGTKILVMRNFINYPDGIPIENVKEGDFVYCFDDNLNPTIQKVLWAGKTGHREVIRVHYTVHGKGKGYLDVTPEHKIRLIDGSYEEAQNLVGDFRKSTDSRRLPKIRALSCTREYDKLNFTGHLKHGKGIHEHRFIYEHFNEKLEEGEIIHHINENHLDHTPTNLEKTNLSDHSRHHAKDTIQSPQGRANSIKRIKRDAALGLCKLRAKKGFDNVQSLKLSKFTCLKSLAVTGGKLTFVPYSFGVFKKYLKLYEIDIIQTQMRFDKHENYIWKSELKKLAKLGRPKVSKILGHNYYRLLKLYEFYGVDPKRTWGNQFGSFVPGNHTITKIEWLHETDDVYDIEVEKYYNFFANEICVHNSSTSPNLQNIPNRDVEMNYVHKFH